MRGIRRPLIAQSQHSTLLTTLTSEVNESVWFWVIGIGIGIANDIYICVDVCRSDVCW